MARSRLTPATLEAPALSDSSRASIVVRGLFETPPVNRGELKTRLAGVPRDDVRRELLSLLEQDGVPERLEQLFSSAFATVKPGPMSSRLAGIALDRARPLRVRFLAHCALIAGDKPTALRVLRELGDDDRAALAQRSLGQVVDSILDASDPGEALRAQLTGPLDVASEGLVFGLELERARSGVSAAALYGPALADGRLASSRRQLVTVLAEDADPEAVAVLEGIAARATDDTLRAAALQAVMRLRARLDARSAPRPQPARGQAWVSACDGQSAYSMLATLGPDHDRSVANLCIRACAEVRDGFVARHASAIEARDLLRQFEQETPMVELPLAQAAWLAQQGEARTAAMRRSVPKDARPALRMLARIEAEPLPDWPVEPGPLPEPDQVSAMLEASQYRMSWFLDEGDLSESDVPAIPGRAEPALNRWMDDAARALEGSSIPARVLEIARHEARRLAWAGDAEGAATFVALGMDLERNGLARSVFFRAMLGATADYLSRETPDDAFMVGDPALRRSLRHEFFEDVRDPVGRDLAALDFTEAILLALDRLVALLPGEQRPPNDAKREASHRLARIVSAAAIEVANGRPRPEQADAMASVLVEVLGLPEDRAFDVVDATLHSVVAFLRDACGSCPVLCLRRPDARVAQEFFHELHPIEQGGVR